MVLDIVWKKSPSNEFLNSARKRLMLKFYSTRLVPLCSTLCLTPDICFKDTVCFLIAYCLPLPERKPLQCNNQQSAQAGCISVQAANSQIFHVSIVTKFHTSVQYFISMINEILVFSIVKPLLHSSLNPWYVRSKFCGNNTPCSETTYKKQNNQALMPGFLCHASSMFVIFGTEKLKWQLLYTQLRLCRSLLRDVWWSFFCKICKEGRPHTGNSLCLLWWISFPTPCSNGHLWPIPVPLYPSTLFLSRPLSHYIDFNYCNTSALNTPTTTICS